MRTNRFFLRTRIRRGRAAAALVAVGTLLASSGLVILAAPAQAAKPGGHGGGGGGKSDGGKVGVCHVNGSDSNPYVYQTVDTSSTDYEGHDDHVQTWGSSVWWNGEWHEAGTEKRDIIPAPSKAYCQEKSTPAITVTPGVDFTDFACGVTGSWSGSYAEKITYSPSATGTAVEGQSVTITAEPNPGYTFARNAQTSFSFTFGKAPEFCGGTVTPGEVTVAQPVCTGPGTSSSPVVTLPKGSADVSYRYDDTSRVVTATAVNDTKFADSLSGGWSRVSDTVATYIVPVEDPGECIEDVTPRTPRATEPSCTDRGHLVLPVGEGYDWTGATKDTVGSHTVTADPWTGYRIDGQSEWTVEVLPQLDGTDCAGDPTPVTPSEPSWVEATCATGPSVDYAEVTGVQYVTEGVLKPGRTVTVVASATGNHVIADDAESSWTHTFAAKPSDCDHTGGPGGGGDNPGGDNPGDGDDEDTVVSPAYPTTVPATCKRDGKLVIPAQPEGVLMDKTGSVPGEVTFSFAPADGYAFPTTGSDTEITLTVAAQKTGAKCAEVLGEEEIRDHGSKNPGSDKNAKGGPEVLGTQAVVPTAVAAGLSGVTMTPSTTTSSPQLAQVLVTAGLLMLVAGGWMGLGRRTRGAHES